MHSTDQPQHRFTDKDRITQNYHTTDTYDYLSRCYNHDKAVKLPIICNVYDLRYCLQMMVRDRKFLHASTKMENYYKTAY